MSVLKIFRNSHFLSLLSNAVIPGLGMLIFIILARAYPDKASFGNWVVFQTVFTLADTFRTGFLQTSLIKFYAGADDDRKASVVGAAWYWGIIITLACCVINAVAYFFVPATDVGMHVTLQWIGISLVCTLPLNVAGWILQADGRFGKLFYVRLLNQGLIFVFICICIVIHKLEFANTLIAFTAAGLVTSLLSFLFRWTKLRHLRKANRSSRTDLFHFGKFSVGTTVSAYLLKSSDTFIIRFVLGDVIGAAAVAVYNLPQKLMELIEIPLRGFIAVAMPIMSTAIHKNDKNYVNYIMTKYAGILSIALIPVSIVAIVCADLIVGLIGGGKYAHSEAGNVFRIFMCYGVLLPVDRFLGITLDILNQPRLNMIKVIIMLVVNVIGDFVGLYLMHSIYGVAIASILTFVAGILYGYWAIKKYLNFSMIDIFVVGFAETKTLLGGLLSKYRSKKA